MCTFVNDWAATAQQSIEEISAQSATSFFPSIASLIRPESEANENCHKEVRIGRNKIRCTQGLGYQLRSTKSNTGGSFNCTTL